MTKNYTVTEINRNWLIKVYGVDENGKRINKLVGVSGLLQLIGVDLAAQAEARARELKWRFEIKERDGRLFLTCDGVAFQEIDPSQTAATVCELLRAARIDAQAYKNINQ